MGERTRPMQDKASVTIPNGTALSGSIAMYGQRITAIFGPAAWTAAVLAFEASSDGGTNWVPVFGDDGTEVSVASASLGTSRCISNVSILQKLNGLPLIRLASGATGARVNQGADRVFTVYVTA